MLNAKQENCEYQLFKSIGLTRRGNRTQTIWEGGGGRSQLYGWTPRKVILLFRPIRIWQQSLMAPTRRFWLIPLSRVMFRCLLVVCSPLSEDNTTALKRLDIGKDDTSLRQSIPIPLAPVIASWATSATQTRDEIWHKYLWGVIRKNKKCFLRHFWCKICIGGVFEKQWNWVYKCFILFNK